MSQTPITEAQWRFVANLPKEQRELNPNPSSNGDEHPVVSVSWYDALEFCARLSLYTERNYRLPSEAEWEYACRAVNLGNPPVVAPTLAEWNEKYNQPFHFGETITSKLANYNGSVIYKQEPKGEYRSQTTPVRTFKPNAFGLYDLHGNVWEWCLDPWHNNYEGAPSDGRVWDEGKEELYEDVLTNLNILLQGTRTHVLRGGSWAAIPGFAVPRIAATVARVSSTAITVFGCCAFPPGVLSPLLSCPFALCPSVDFFWGEGKPLRVGMYLEELRVRSHSSKTAIALVAQNFVGGIIGDKLRQNLICQGLAYKFS
jgi:formylglycine-generating enzyme required for sulfatase activity